MSIKSAVNKVYSEQYSFPKGWSTKAQVARELDCSEERVNDVLKPALAAGMVEMKMHKVWIGKTVTRVCGYREVPKKGK